MASLQARHSRSCGTGKPWTTFTAAQTGCTCEGGPSYYVVVRDGLRLHRERVGRNRKQAERALTKVQAVEDEGAYVAQQNIRFAAWADAFLANLEREPSTVRSYTDTMRYATAAFGDKPVRKLAPQDVRRFLELMRDAKASDSTRAKHLRVLTACLNSAVAHGYAARNVARDLPKGERPRKRKRESAYFTNDELPRLFAELRPGSYRMLCLAGLKTGCRLGELLALTWTDVDVAEQVIHVRRSYTGGRIARPKSHEVRQVDVADDLVHAIGAWWGELGRPAETTLVFPGETRRGYVNDQVLLRRELYPAMERAGVPRVGPTGEKRTFHSLRHTFAKRALETGRPVTWLSRHLGHSSLAVTTEVYGHWEPAERRREAREMAGVFGV